MLRGGYRPRCTYSSAKPLKLLRNPLSGSGLQGGLLIGYILLLKICNILKYNGKWLMMKRT